MRLDLTLMMERPQAVIQKRSEREYRNVPFPVSRQKEYNRCL
jgi:hypothetical protein